MVKQMGLIANLGLCMGCFACEIACKQERNLPEGEKGIKVVTLGPYEVKGELAMDFIPMATEKCDLCSNRTADGERPFCAQICPTQALMLYDDEKILGALRGDNRFHICKIEE